MNDLILDFSHYLSLSLSLSLSLCQSAVFSFSPSLGCLYCFVIIFLYTNFFFFFCVFQLMAKSCLKANSLLNKMVKKRKRKRDQDLVGRRRKKRRKGIQKEVINIPMMMPKPPHLPPQLMTRTNLSLLLQQPQHLHLQ